MKDQLIPFEQLPAPAQRALAGAGLATLQQLAKKKESEIKKLHGLGPKTLRILREVMTEHQLAFAK